MEALKVGTVLACLLQMICAVKFEEVMNVIKERRLDLSKHQFFEFLKDESLPLKKRMVFVPYWTFYALTAADILDSWIRVPKPQNELEERINAFIGEDNFHYNFFLHDVENVLGYTPERFGSYGAVLRHIWGDDSKAVRQMLYSWAAVAKKYDEPMIVLVSFEVIEAGLKDFFEIAYEHIYKPGREGGLKDLKYFGETHIQLEANHTVTSWFREGEQPYRPLADFDVSEEIKMKALEVVDELFYRYHVMYDALYKLAVVKDSIWPKKYEVEGYPAISAFPKDHPNRPQTTETKDEL